ncbi:aminopeptidase N-like [Saccoglossus kowalevskii]|uniref:Aminopeptidase n=1 Tax=Saccoglossus kowalevskii TaxID=10224 RepID=A0ABM0MLU0_SACKO|nr:PREDICTED: aminopeptidase N-like [Saccoglossus kowalevskii]
MTDSYHDTSKHTQRQIGCYVSRLVAVVITCFVVVVFALSVMLTIYLSDGTCEETEDVMMPQPGEIPEVIDEFEGMLPDTIEPFHYRVWLKPYMDQHLDADDFLKLDGKTDIYILCIKTTNEIKVHVRLMAIRTSKIYDKNGNELEIVNVEENLKYNWFVIRTKDDLVEGNEYRLHFEYEGTIDQQDLRGFFYVSYEENGQQKSYAATQFQSTRARDAFPCFDEPALKATFDTVLVHRPTRMALSNMPNIGNITVTDTNGGEWVEAHFNTSVKMSTYLNAYFIGEFHCKEDYTENGIQFRVWSMPSKLNTTIYSLDIGMDILTNFETQWDISYQLPKLDSVALPIHVSTGMENWGLILYREPYMLYDPVEDNPGDKKGVVVLVGHEIAHMWFGNLVTMEWWSHTWLNEGFASYLESYGFLWVEPEYELRDQFFLKDHTYRAMRMDQYGDSRPLVTPAGFYDEINSLFDILAYDKGSALILMMSGFLGEPDLIDALRHYLKSHSYGSVITDDLWASMNEVIQESHNLDMKYIMDPWVLQMGFPVINITRITTTMFRAYQSHFLINPFDEPKDEHYTNMGYVWVVPLSYTHEQELEFKNPNLLWLEENSLEFEIQGLTNTDWVLLNINQTAYIRVNYDIENWRKLAKQLTYAHEVIPVRSRSHLVDDALTLGEALHLDHVVALEVIEYFREEDEHMPWQAFVDVKSYTKYMLWRSSTYGLYENYLRYLVSPNYYSLGWEFDDNELEYYRRINSLSVACENNLRNCIENAKARYKSWIDQPENNPIEPDIRDTVYCTAIRHGGDQEWKFAYDMQTRAHEDRDLLQSSMACSRITWILLGYLEESLHSEYFDTGTVIGYVRDKSATGFILAWRFAVKNFQHLLELYGQSAYDIIWQFSEKMYTEKDLNELIGFGQQYYNMPTEAANNFYRALQKIQVNMQWQARNGNDIHAFLQTFKEI